MNTTTIQIDLTRLRELATRATFARWAVYTGGDDCLIEIIEDRWDEHEVHVGSVIVQAIEDALPYGNQSGVLKAVNAEFIAACSPPVVIDLLDRLATLEAKMHAQHLAEKP
ncbi:hypothetical protein [Burkholderia diffusa]|uniref:hypothetical protein n=1 Tax=Burkholderia diffusa TaxID=488732 RepID=UPI00075C0600|nr:hypothetical protein [Burkholderia diffusa]KVH51197.1 hypothetical protein WJ39_08575 [Burkholderia diffusa]